MIRPLVRLARPAFLVTLAIGPMVPTAPAGEIRYHVTNLGIRQPIGLNDAGQVALNQTASFGYDDPVGTGRHSSQATYTHAVLYDSYGPNSGGMTFVGRALPAAQGDRGGLDSVTTFRGKVIAKPEKTDIATGLNAAGQVSVTSAAGTFLTDGKTSEPSTPSPGFLTLPDGTRIGTKGPAAINGSGQVAGTFSDPAFSNAERAVLLTDGKLTPLGTLGGPTSIANAVNASGQVVGESRITPTDGTSPYDAPSHAFLSRGGTMKDLGTLGRGNSVAHAINAEGQVVGAADSSSGNYDYFRHSQGQRAFLFDGERTVNLNSLIADHLNLTLNSAVAINSRGQILALGQAGSNDLDNAYLLTPVSEPEPGTPTTAPEPGTLAIVGLAVGLAWLRGRSSARNLAAQTEMTR